MYNCSLCTLYKYYIKISKENVGKNLSKTVSTLTSLKILKPNRKKYDTKNKVVYIPERIKVDVLGGEVSVVQLLSGPTS